MKNTLNFETWLPLFVGFYETYLNGDNDLDSYLDDDVNEGEKVLTFDDLDIDYKEHQKEVSKWMVSKINELIADELDIDCCIKMQELRSPKYYNFETDSINISIDITQKELNKIKVLINDNFEPIEQIIKSDYTSRDGFISSYSNDINDWDNDTKNWSDYSNDGHKLGKVLEMLLQVVCDNAEESIMNDFLESDVSLFNYIAVKE